MLLFFKFSLKCLQYSLKDFFRGDYTENLHFLCFATYTYENNKILLKVLFSTFTSSHFASELKNVI